MGIQPVRELISEGEPFDIQLDSTQIAHHSFELVPNVIEEGTSHG